MGRMDVAVLQTEGLEGHRIYMNMSRPQDLAKWEHLNDIPLPEISGKEVMLLIGANVREAEIYEEVCIGGA